MPSHAIPFSHPGSAAIHGLRGKKNVQVFILYPKGRVSEVQEKQMTTVRTVADTYTHTHMHAYAYTNAGCDDVSMVMDGGPTGRVSD